MQQAERQQIRKAIRLIRTNEDYDAAMAILCAFAQIASPEDAIPSRVLSAFHRKAEQFSTNRGKYCACGHGLTAHRSSAGARATFCRRDDCTCTQYTAKNSQPEKLTGQCTCPPQAHTVGVWTARYRLEDCPVHQPENPQ